MVSSPFTARAQQPANKISIGFLSVNTHANPDQRGQ
jgi:hypothetical protein